MIAKWIFKIISPLLLLGGCYPDFGKDEENLRSKGKYEFGSLYCDENFVVNPIGFSYVIGDLNLHEEGAEEEDPPKKSHVYIQGHQKKCTLKFTFSLDYENVQTSDDLECSGGCEIPIEFHLPHSNLARDCDGKTRCPATLSCSSAKAVQFKGIKNNVEGEEAYNLNLLLNVNHGTSHGAYYRDCSLQLQKKH